jgi:hypothetical protein
MKKRIALLLITLLACQGSEEPAPDPEPDGPLVGGWVQQDVKADITLSNLGYLVESLILDGQQIAIEKVLSSETQVVAGYNIRLTISGTLNGVSGVGTAVIYSDVSQEKFLVDFTWEPKTE